MSGISLTSSMRSNLLSLQQTAKLQDLTQNRLATGLKVNSAIDNPSSYYTAQSLNNRAEDLNILLDAMSQGIQTLKAVNESIEAGTKFLEQAKSVANTGYEQVIKDNWSLYTGPVAAEVETEAELINAINNTAEGSVIVIKNDITLSNNTGIKLKNGQKLVGQNFIDGKGGAAKLTFNFDASTASAIGIDLAENSMLADLKIDYTSSARVDNRMDFYAVRNLNQRQTEMRNVDVVCRTDSSSAVVCGAVFIGTGAEIIFDGAINIDLPLAHSEAVMGIVSESGDGLLIQNKNSVLNISTAGKWGYGIREVNCILNGTVNIHTAGDIGFAVSGGLINLASSQARLNTNSEKAIALNNISLSGVAGAEVMTAHGIFKMEQDISQPLNAIVSDDLSIRGLLKTGNFDLERLEPASYSKTVQYGYAQQFNQILEQYNQLINDSWYKGVNLLKNQDLKVVFNESRTSDLDIKGVDATAKGLGLEQAEWTGSIQVQNSLDQIDSAINQLRLYASEFGNYYQIVTTRENFTNSLINVLTEGADALTLADMNQESANMLALQTRQQLAVNSLSLASQASQSVLKLF